MLIRGSLNSRNILTCRHSEASAYDPRRLATAAKLERAAIVRMKAVGRDIVALGALE